MDKKKNFTAIEIIIVVIIIGILATLVIPKYQNFMENQKAKVCETNLKVLLGAVNSFALENDKLPASLGQLKNEHIQKAYAKVLKQEKSWKIKLAYFIVNFNKGKVAFAQNYWQEMTKLKCPADDSPPPAGHSYGLNQALVDMSLSDFKNLPDNTVIIADSNNSTFPPVASRHNEHKLFEVNHYSQEISKGGTIYKPGKKAVDGGATKGKIPGTGATKDELPDTEATEDEFPDSEGGTTGQTQQQQSDLSNQSGMQPEEGKEDDNGEEGNSAKNCKWRQVVCQVTRKTVVEWIQGD
jgi:type II secretory pathway pseudopilin PulG